MVVLCGTNVWRWLYRWVELMVLLYCGRRWSKYWITFSTTHLRTTRQLEVWPSSSFSATSISEKWDARRSISPLLHTWSNPFKLWFSVSNLYLPNERANQVCQWNFQILYLETFWIKLFPFSKWQKESQRKRKQSQKRQWHSLLVDKADGENDSSSLISITHYVLCLLAHLI